MGIKKEWVRVGDRQGQQVVTMSNGRQMVYVGEEEGRGKKRGDALAKIGGLIGTAMGLSHVLPTVAVSLAMKSGVIPSAEDAGRRMRGSSPKLTRLRHAVRLVQEKMEDEELLLREGMEVVSSEVQRAYRDARENTSVKLDPPNKDEIGIAQQIIAQARLNGMDPRVLLLEYFKEEAAKQVRKAGKVVVGRKVMPVLRRSLDLIRADESGVSLIEMGRVESTMLLLLVGEEGGGELPVAFGGSGIDIVGKGRGGKELMVRVKKGGEYTEIGPPEEVSMDPTIDDSVETVGLILKNGLPLDVLRLQGFTRRMLGSKLPPMVGSLRLTSQQNEEGDRLPVLDVGKAMETVGSGLRTVGEAIELEKDIEEEVGSDPFDVFAETALTAPRARVVAGVVKELGKEKDGRGVQSIGVSKALVARTGQTGVVVVDKKEEAKSFLKRIETSDGKNEEMRKLVTDFNGDVRAARIKWREKIESAKRDAGINR